MSVQGRISRCNSQGRYPALALYRPGGTAMRLGPANAPFVSINFGAAGIAYAIYRLARARGEHRLLVLARDWVQRAYGLSCNANAFYDLELGVAPEKVGQVSLFYSASGLHCTAALVRAALGDMGAAARAIDAFVQQSRGPCDSPDLTVGTASLLLGCAELVESIDMPSLACMNLLRMRGDEIANVLSEMIASEQIATSSRIRLLGVAHGWAGIVFALLRWTRATRRSVDPVLAAKLDELADLAIPYEDGVCWTMHNNSSSLMPGWCHGTSGHAMLFALAHEVLPDPTYAELAQRAAASAWNIATANGSLCCGNGGNGYAFLAAYRLTGDRVWLERAYVATQRASGDTSKLFFRDSLYKGALGVTLLQGELEIPGLAAMPLFEPVRFKNEVST